MTEKNGAQGWVRNYRKIENWSWYKTPHMAHLFQHLIRKANHRNFKWEGRIIKRGQLITSQRKLSQETGISKTTIARCLDRMADHKTDHKTDHEITIEADHHKSIITILNYRVYQPRAAKADHQTGWEADHKTDHNPGHKRTTSGPQADHNLYKNEKNEKNEKKEKAASAAASRFLEIYPAKKGAKAVRDWFADACPNDDEVRTILDALRTQVEHWNRTKANGGFAPAWPSPVKWLEEERWNDEPDSSGDSKDEQLERLQEFGKRYGL